MRIFWHGLNLNRNKAITNKLKVAQHVQTMIRLCTFPHFQGRPWCYQANVSSVLMINKCQSKSESDENFTGLFLSFFQRSNIYKTCVLSVLTSGLTSIITDKWLKKRGCLQSHTISFLLFLLAYTLHFCDRCQFGQHTVINMRRY